MTLTTPQNLSEAAIVCTQVRQDLGHQFIITYDLTKTPAERSARLIPYGQGEEDVIVVDGVTAGAQNLTFALTTQLEKLRNVILDGFLVINGEKLFPIGIFDAYPDESEDIETVFAELKDAGFNCIQHYEVDEGFLVSYCSAAVDAGLLVLASPGARVTAWPAFTDEVSSVLSTLGNNSTILSWYLGDEPDQTGNSAAEVQDLADFIASAESNRAGSLLIADPDFYSFYTDCTDIFVIDSYPIPNNPVTDVSDKISAADIALSNSKPVWPIIQAFGTQSGVQSGYSNATWTREPTYDEMRTMTYLAIAKGAKGIFYFTYNMYIPDPNRYFIKRTSGHWSGLKDIVSELNTIYPLLTASNASAIDFSGTGGDAGNPLLIYTTRQIDSDASGIDAGKYVLAVNASSQPINVSLDIGASGEVTEIFASRSLSGTSGVYADSVSAYGAYMYWAVNG